MVAGTGEAERRPVEDRPVISFASPQRLRGVGAADELSDLASDGGQHRDLVVLDLARVPGEELDDADHRSAVDHWESDHRLEAGHTRDVDVGIVAALRQVFDRRDDARLPDPAEQPDSERNRGSAALIPERFNGRFIAMPEMPHPQRLPFGIRDPELGQVLVEVCAQAAVKLLNRTLPRLATLNHLPTRSKP